MIHDVHKVMSNAIIIEDQDEAAAANVVDDENDFRQKCSRRARQAKEAVQSIEHRVAVVQAVWAGEPLEKLSNELQYEDEQGECLIKAVADDGPVFHAEAELFKRVTSSPDIWFTLSLLTHHFADSEEVNIVDFERSCFGKIMSLAGGLWSIYIYIYIYIYKKYIYI